MQTAMSTRAQIIAAALDLVRQDGVEAATARAVCDRAGVKAPTLYYHFGNIAGLHRALVDAAFAESLARKRVAPSDDPAEEIARGWDAYIAFAREEPHIFALMNRTIVAPDMPNDGLRSLARLEELFAALPAGTVANPVDEARVFWATAHGTACLVASAALNGMAMSAEAVAAVRAATVTRLGKRTSEGG